MQPWYKVGYCEQRGGGLQLKYPELGLLFPPHACAAQDTEVGGVGLLSPRGSPSPFSHFPGHDKKYKCFEVSLCVVCIGHWRHVINSPHGANIREEINSFKGV